MRMNAILAVCFISACAGAAANESQQVAKGAKLFAEHCQLCHGADGQKGDGFQTPIWGPQAKIGAKFEKAQQLYEYIQITMPFDDPNKLSDPQRWEVIAYMLAKHGAIAASDTLDPAKARGIPIK